MEYKKLIINNTVVAKYEITGLNIFVKVADDFICIEDEIIKLIGVIEKTDFEYAGFLNIEL